MPTIRDLTESDLAARTKAIADGLDLTHDRAVLYELVRRYAESAEAERQQWKKVERRYGRRR